MKWIKDEEFLRGKVPMTKFEVRIAALAVMEICQEDILVDIGAGTGSISIQAALFGSKVYAVEQNEEGVNLIKENNLKFNTEIKVIEGKAPEKLSEVRKFNKVFIGGSKGNLKEILSYVNGHIEKGGIVAANFITMNNLNTFLNFIRENSYEDIVVKLIQVSYMDRMGLLKANNPVFLVRGKKP
ncbi:precorrin-6Y C5,15-methyltransferase (decarboxylating) subunit CbiT [Clostridium guangxiense]|uniref:precorrin-6Y C5,15-methyltransferase (decarboxylating) subunit CbiT n=1 Tax=Clostridium guangxiense TaxID=1662055 RepID=UPI001E2A967D|nr:precorrin-6Y C5,15-methyltransferase (decarboxylating) subunit CbiT [Clostridium guangxiense]MCD2348505.1 precorrin-6Y C5,15-methyltransferase (decarboxylating) subunit CbiT [Clostridium guangxiense]